MIEPVIPIDPEEMLREYQRAIGTSAAIDAHGWGWVGRLVDSATIWSFGSKSAWIGWGAVTPEPSEHSAWVSLGVLPDHRKQGYRYEIADWCARWALQRWSTVRQGVLVTNPTHLQRMLRESREGSLWAHSGTVWYPAPAYHIFTRAEEPMPRAGEPQLHWELSSYEETVLVPQWVADGPLGGLTPVNPDAVWPEWLKDKNLPRTVPYAL